MNPLYPNKESVPEADLNAEKEIILTRSRTTKERQEAGSRPRKDGYWQDRQVLFRKVLA